MKIYIIAGETSGDLLGGQIMAALKSLHPSVSFAGVGGTSMTQEGLVSLFPMHSLSVMGLVEVIPSLPKILRCLKRVTEDIRRLKPDLILTIDAPAFTYRVAKRTKALGIPLFHVTAPTVWAWRPQRAKALARVYDHLFCLFPFEPPYFEKEGLPTTFIGHPLVDMLKPYKRPYNPDGPLILLLGSRQKELQTFIPLFQTLLNQNTDWISKGVVIPTLPLYEAEVRKAFAAYGATIITDVKEKYTCMASARLALAASGTVTLELGLLGIPMIIGYRVNTLSAWVLKRLMRIPFVSLVNILLDKSLIPELLQENCTAQAFNQQISCGKEWQAQRPDLKRLEDILSSPTGQSAANIVAQKIIEKDKDKTV